MRLLIVLIVVAAVYTAQLELYRKYWNVGLSVKLRFSKDVVTAGEQAELLEVIENEKPLALPLLNVKFATSRSFDFDEEENANISDQYYRNDIFSILGNQRLERRLKFDTTRRGLFRIDELQVSTRDLFLKHTFAMIMSNDTTITVLPERIPLENYVEIRNLMTGDYPINRINPPDPFLFRGIRQYQPYDTMGSINWKASARMNELMVNQYQVATENEARIYLNLRPYMKSQADALAEHAIRIVSTIAADFINHGIRVGFYTNGWDIDSGVFESEGAVIHDRAARQMWTQEHTPEASTGEEVKQEPGHPVLASGLGREHLKALDILLARLDISKMASNMSELLDTCFEPGAGQVTHVIVSTYRDDAMYHFFEQHMNQVPLYWIIPERSGNEVDIRYPGIFRWDER